MVIIGTEFKRQLKLLSLQSAASLKHAEAFEAACDYRESEGVAEKNLLSLLSLHAEKLGYELVEKAKLNEEVDGKHGEDWAEILDQRNRELEAFGARGLNL